MYEPNKNEVPSIFSRILSGMPDRIFADPSEYDRKRGGSLIPTQPIHEGDPNIQKSPSGKAKFDSCTI